jgi:hypothetical protein
MDKDKGIKMRVRDDKEGTKDMRRCTCDKEKKCER